MISTAIVRKQIYHTLIVFLSLLSVGYSIKCFQCNSIENPGCDNLTVNDTTSVYYKECSGNYDGKKPFCRKISTDIIGEDDSVRVARSCGWIQNVTNTKDMCRKGDTDFIRKKHCECFTDACNSSNKIAPLLTSFIVVTMVFNLFRGMG